MGHDGLALNPSPFRMTPSGIDLRVPDFNTPRESWMTVDFCNRGDECGVLHLNPK